MFSVAQIPFCMALSTLFEDSRMANQIGGLLLLFPELLFLYLASKTDGVRNLIYLMYLLPVGPACELFVHLSSGHDEKSLEYSFIRTEWISQPATWAALILNIPFWIMMYQYFDAIMPSEYGISQHPCFCCMKTKKAKLRDPQNLGDIEANNKIYDELDPIKFEGLTKMFGDFKAVNNLKFSIKQGEVFTFLGHNGAGKTTTIYMLTGMLGASSGDATVYGYSVNRSVNVIQKNLGLCQQFDVLFDLLTVKEHLILVCELKNVAKEQIEQTVNDTIQFVMLTEFKDKLVKELSGGMKRKLSLAMAIVSKPKLIILDEPTSGLDIESRK